MERYLEQFDLMTGIDSPRDVNTADVDGDGDLDVLVAESGTCSPTFPFACTGRVLWLENDDLTFTKRVIDNGAPRARSVSSADLDLDGDLDIVAGTAPSAGFQLSALTWYEHDGASPPSFTEHTIVSGFEIGGPTGAVVADLDRDGDPDLVSSSRNDDRVAWYPNRGGQFSVSGSDTAPDMMVPGARDDVLKIALVHQGRAGDSDVELVSLDLMFGEAPGDPLSTVEGLLMFDEIALYRDDGSGAFESTFDTVLRAIADPVLLGGQLRMGLNALDGDNGIAAAHGASATLFVVVTLGPEAAGKASPMQFRVTLQGRDAGAEDRSFDLPLILQRAEDFTSSTVHIAKAVRGDCNADFRLDLLDLPSFVDCLTGPASAPPGECGCADFNDDTRIDLEDAADLQTDIVTE